MGVRTRIHLSTLSRLLAHHPQKPLSASLIHFLSSTSIYSRERSHLSSHPQSMYHSHKLLIFRKIFSLFFSIRTMRMLYMYACCRRRDYMSTASLCFHNRCYLHPSEFSAMIGWLMPACRAFGLGRLDAEPDAEPARFAPLIMAS